MSKPIIYFVTTNEFKFKSFTEAINLDTYEIRRLAIETPEIQADNNRTVAEYSAQWAANTHKQTVIAEDVGIYIKALKGFPGPFLSQAEKQLGVEGFLSLLHDKEERGIMGIRSRILRAGQRTGFLPRYPERQYRQTTDWHRWMADGEIFIQEGQTETISMLLEKDSYVRNNSHYTQLCEYLSS